MKDVSLKLDFNERADSTPAWLSAFALNSDELWRYPDRTALEQQLATDLQLPPSAVLLTNGGDESIELLYKLCKLTDQSLLVPEPCFSQYTHNQKIWQNDTIFVPANEDLSIDTQAITAAMKPNQWVILTRPNNPTGEFLESGRLLELIKAASQVGAKVFLDEAYVEFANEGEGIDYAAHQNLVTLRTFSKAFGLAGARIGYVFGQPELIAEFRRLAMPFNVSRANLQLATAAWQARDEVSVYCQRIAENRTQIAQFLEKNGLQPFPSKGNFLLFQTNPRQKILFDRVMKKSGIQIKTELADLPNAVRLTIPENTTALMNALQLILDPQLLAFDMDGVLIDTTASYDECIRQTVATLTPQQVTQQDIEKVRAKGGFNNDWVLCAELIKQTGNAVDFDTVVSTFQSIYLGTAEQPGLVSQEKNLLLDPMRQRVFKSSTYRTAVVTGRPRAEAEQGTAQLDINPNELVSADDVSQQKPDPQGLLQVMRDTAAERAWYCGDTVDDMQAGQAAGCVCIGIGAKTTQAKNNLFQAGADVVLENINQLETLL